MADRRPRKVGILTSGGDAPGMNAAIRAITRTALKEGLSVIGFYRGYEGVVNKHYTELERKSVANIVQRGGTILRSARCAEFMTPAGRDKAADNLRELGVDVLFVIGGDGSLKGALALREHWDGQVIGLPGTIDNDLDGTDYTIGYFTALDTAVHAIDKVRDTADAFERIFLVEVMGRMAGFIALGVGDSRATGKLSCIIVVAEGVVHRGVKSLDERITIHDSSMLAKEIQRETGLDSRAVILGHIQRGGNPAALDRMLASMLGTYAVEAALKGETDVMAGIHAQKRCLVPLAETWAERKSLDDFMLHVQHTLA
jgi:6-phosphofructokinase 1